MFHPCSPPLRWYIGLEWKERPPPDGKSTSGKIPDLPDAQDTPASAMDEHSSQDPADPCLIFLRSIWHRGEGRVKTGNISTTWEFFSSRYEALQTPLHNAHPPFETYLHQLMMPATNNRNDWQMKLENNNKGWREVRKSNYVISVEFIPTTIRQ